MPRYYTYKNAQSKFNALGKEIEKATIINKSSSQSTLEYFSYGVISETNVNKLLGKDFIYSLNLKTDIGNIKIKSKDEIVANGYADSTDLTTIYIGKHICIV